MQNKLYKRGLVFVVLFLVKVTTASAQAPQSVKGKIKGNSVNGRPGIEIMMQHKDAKYESMEKFMFGIFSTVAHAPAVNLPRGFDIDPSLSIYCDLNPVFAPYEGSADSNKAPVQAALRMTWFNYYLDQYSHKIKKAGESHGGLELFVNDLSNVLPDEFKNQCSDTGVRLFFLLPKITSESDGQIVVGNHIIILKKKGKAVFTPLTKRGYTQFMIRKLKHDLSQAKDEVIQNKEDLKEEQHNLASNTDPKVKGYIRQSINSSNAILSASIKKVGKLEDLLHENQDSLSKMSAAEVQTPVYVIQNFKDPSGDFYYKLFSPSAQGAQKLYTVNPEYYNPALPRSAIQLIVVDYHASNFCPPFMKKRLTDWFQQINCNKLSALIAS